MPNIVGYGNTQIPTNAMLGDLAYQDSVGEIDLEKIKARTGDNATDIFVYDTRKDSDGGAWRHRTQNTSWYNEGVSAKRGARKEFPAVAVIVAAYENLTIYDGDDPNLPMWMDFDYGSSGLASITMLYANGKGVSALNGVICSVGSAGWHDGLTAIDFIADNAKWRNSSYIAYWNNGIGNRNVAGGYGSFITAPNEIIVAAQVNDVAMTVLPNAPINPATGLPVPTIALATDGGTNIINDDGTVTQGYQTIATQNVDLHPAGYMTDGISGATNDSFSFYIIDSIQRVSSYGHRIGIQPIDTFVNQATGQCLFEGGGNKLAFAQSHGLLRVEETLLGYAIREDLPLVGGLHNKTTSSYNTGWMPAYAKGAFLSSTDATDATYSTVADDWATAGAWTKQGSITISSTGSGTSGTLSITGNGTGSNVYFFNPITVEANTDYVVSITFGAENANTFVINTTQYNAGTGVLLDINALSGLTRGGHFNSGSNTTLYIQGWQTSTSATTITNLVIQKVSEKDRSVNNKGLLVFGTVKKRVVEAGAELVSYNGLTSSNYLEQPYNSDLNFGTGDFCMIGWFYNLGLSSSILYRLHNSTTVGTGYIVALSSGGELGYSSYTQGFRSAGRITHYSSDTWNGQQRWNMFVCGKRGGYGYTYVNGILKQTAINANSHTDTTYKPPLRIGNNHAGSGGLGGGKLALIRISSTFPSEKQIKKMYNDEKCLFHENAKCTFYGTSNDVKALAYDDTNDILHVGTSGGRSEFRGLNRINNTTTAVTTAISASNGLVAEQ